MKFDFEILRVAYDYTKTVEILFSMMMENMNMHFNNHEVIISALMISL